MVTNDVRQHTVSQLRSRTTDEYLNRSAHKIFIEELPTSIPGEVSYKHLCRGSSRYYCKDLLRRISTASPYDLLARTSARSCAGLG